MREHTFLHLSLYSVDSDTNLYNVTLLLTRTQPQTTRC